MKKLSNLHALPDKQFVGEITCLKKAKHKNVVRFLGYCADRQGSMEEFDKKLVMADVHERLLCFEYIPKGSLDKYIMGKSTTMWPLTFLFIFLIYYKLLNVSYNI